MNTDRPIEYRLEWVDENAQKRYKRYTDLYKAEKAERWAIENGATSVYLVAIIDAPAGDKNDKERAEQFGL